MNPTRLPEMFKPSRDLGNQKTQHFRDQIFLEKPRKFNEYSNFSVQTSGGVPGEDFDMENPNLRSKMKSKRLQGGK